MGLTTTDPSIRVAFADTAIEIHCEDAELAITLRQVFRHCDGLTEPRVIYRITRPQPNLWLTERLVRRYYDEPLPERGAYLFFIAKKPERQDTKTQNVIR